MSLFMEIYTIFETTRQLLGISANLLLIYCIMMKSPGSVASYSVLLLNSGSTDLVICFTHLFIQPRSMIVGTGAYFISYGFCVVTGYKSCMIGYGVITLLYGQYNICRLASFLYRWHILHLKTPKKLNVIVYAVLLTLPSIALFAVCSVPMITSYWSQDFKDVVLKVHPEEIASTITTFGAPNAFNNLLAAIPTYWVLGSILLLTLTAVFLRWWILRYLDQQTLYSEQNKKMQTDILNALSIQASLSLLYFVGTFVSVYGRDLSPGTQVFYEVARFFFSGFTPFVAPFITLYLIVPYNKFVRSLLGHIDFPPVSPFVNH